MSTEVVRGLVAFALDLADSIEVTVEGVSASEYGNVSLYAWNTGAEAISQIADRQGWPAEVYEGDGWAGRRQEFDVDGRSVRIDLIGYTKPAAEVES